MIPWWYLTFLKDNFYARQVRQEVRSETEPPVESVRRLQQAVHVAEEVGTMLGLNHDVLRLVQIKKKSLDEARKKC